MQLSPKRPTVSGDGANRLERKSMEGTLAGSFPSFERPRFDCTTL